MTKKEEQEKAALLKTVSRVNSLWEFLAFVAVILRSKILLIPLLISIGVNIGFIAKYTNAFGAIFKALLSFFGVK